MRFTRLRLNGFKSFVDPTDLVIHDGLTGIVGPNGCGKSNLLEAMRWVMGENRASAMRGDGMDDVIFAGASRRPARHFAEVALVVDNEGRTAPVGYNDADQIEIVRRITRDAGSAFRVNGREARARDVQMLFADASTGSHSPALVRQGQIAELINARPKARRRILEEAAGISGLYQRRHEAELRLTGAEANLSRVADVLEGLAAQVAMLTRQARQAARYREIGEDLRRAEGMLLYRRWREADAARGEADAALRDALGAAARAEVAARAAGEARAAADAALPPLRDEAAIAAALRQRLTVEHAALTDEQARAGAAIAALSARLGQMAQDLDREGALNRDAEASIARLEDEAAQIARDQNGHDARLAEATGAARAAAAALAQAEPALAEATEEAARLAARHQSAQRLAQDAGTTLARAEAAARASVEGVAAADAAASRAATAFAEAETSRVAAIAHATMADTALAGTETARAEAQAREAEARAARSGAEGEANALRAELAALERLIARETGAGGQLLDLLRVAEGAEAALGAALADDLRAPVVVGSGQASGWHDLPPYDADQPLPDGAEPLAASVTAPPVLSRRLAQVGLVTASDGARLQPLLRPGQRLVSREGDLWRWDGFRQAAADAPSAAALRLRQMNRLAQLRRDEGDASARAAGAAQAHEALALRLADLARADAAARDARRAADARVAEASRAAARAEADGSIAAGRAEACDLATRRHADEAKAAAGRLAEATAALTALPDLAASRTAVDAARTAAEAARLAVIARRGAQDDLSREGQARIRRAQQVATELAGWRHRLETADRRRADLSTRRAEAEGDLSQAEALPAVLDARSAALTEGMETAAVREAAAADALALAETALRAAQTAEREAERGAGESREARARSEARAEAARDACDAAALRIAEETGLEPAALLDTLAADPDAMPDAATLDIEVNRLRRQREALGAVNLRAETDMEATQGEHDTLLAEKTDLESAIAKLRAGISGLNREGRERLLTAFEQVNASFATLFKHLFGGGEARLVLVESDDPLEAGLEIMGQPPGKKLSTMSLLSGGEQTLTALALIFAVFLANPAPICVLDEVDAPLDDANVTRFCDLLDEMARRTETRFLIITHHAVTMARMDRLYGVTMVEQGVSQLVSVDLKKAAALVA